MSIYDKNAKVDTNGNVTVYHRTNADAADFLVKPDSIYRIWFGFAEYSGDEIMPPEITPIVRKGFTVVEWGGAVLD